MILASEKVKDKDNNDVYNRVSWTKHKDGSVRQLWETVTTIAGKEQITIAFDGLYKPKK